MGNTVKLGQILQLEGENNIMEDNWAKLIKKYKSLIVPKDGDFEGIIQYAQRNYTITCITKSYLEMLDAKIFIDNMFCAVS